MIQRDGPKAGRSAEPGRRFSISKTLAAAGGVFIALSAAAVVWEWIALYATEEFFRSGSTPAADRLDSDPSSGANASGDFDNIRSADLPPASVIIPLKGGTPANRASIEGMLDQDYRVFEVIVGIAEGDQAAANLVRTIQRERPAAALRLVEAPNRLGGPRPKVSNLHNASETAQHSYLALIDADILAGKDFLRSLLSPLLRTRTGLTSSLYRAGAGGGFWSRMDGLWSSTAYLPSALFGRRVIGEGFAFGAAIGLRRDVLDRIGGFAAISGQVGDDYQLGHIASSRGYRVELIPYLVTEQVEEISFRQFIRRRTRWARTIRTHQPAGYAGSFLMYGVPLAICGSLLKRPVRWGWLGSVLANRIVCAGLNRRRLDPGAPAWELLLTPVRDILALVVWGLGFFTEKARRGGAPSL